MKTKILFLSIFALSLFWLISCDVIEEPFFRDTITGDTTGIDTVSFDPTPQLTRGVLLEEFTGHKCPNCPAASLLAHDLKEANPGKVSVVSIHSGVFATVDGAGDFTYDFRTSEGAILDGFFKVGDYGYPNGLISRKKVDANKYIVSPQNWTKEVDSLKDQPAIASIALNAYETGGTIKCYARIKFIGANSNQYKLALLVTEDSIFRPQKNNNPAVGTVPVITDYQHRGVLRSAINGTWGSALNSGPVADQQVFLAGYSIPMGVAWTPEHCNVVAYIYDKVSLEVYQVKEVRLQ